MTRITPIAPFLKVEKPKRDPGYLAKVRELPCCICQEYEMEQRSTTQAHHPICDRHGTHRAPDQEAIPLCEGHHQGDLDTSKIAIHRQREEWVEKYGSDRDWIARTQDAINGELN